MMLPNVKDFFHSCDFFKQFVRVSFQAIPCITPRPTFARRSCIAVPWSVHLEGFVFRDVNGDGSGWNGVFPG